MKIKIITTMILLISIIFTPYDEAEPGVLFHATKRSIAKRIIKKGINPQRMSKKARFGKGVYLSKSKKTAIKEKPASEAVVIFKGSKTLEDKTINLNKLNQKQIIHLSGDNNLRGNIHNGIVGPDLGHKIGKSAGNKGNVILYPSVRDKGGANYFIPKKVYLDHPRIVTPKRVINNAK